jgi:hypothetical protein
MASSPGCATTRPRSASPDDFEDDVFSQSLGKSALVQCIVLIPVSFLGVYAGGALAADSFRALFGERSEHLGQTALAALVFLVPLVCLWITILSDSETIRWRPVVFGFVALGLVTGCVAAGVVVYQASSSPVVPIGILLFVMSAFIPGVIQLVRVTRLLWRYRIERRELRALRRGVNEEP